MTEAGARLQVSAEPEPQMLSRGEEQSSDATNEPAHGQETSRPLSAATAAAGALRPRYWRDDHCGGRRPLGEARKRQGRRGGASERVEGRPARVGGDPGGCESVDRWARVSLDARRLPGPVDGWARI